MTVLYIIVNRSISLLKQCELNLINWLKTGWESACISVTSLFVSCWHCRKRYLKASPRTNVHVWKIWCKTESSTNLLCMYSKVQTYKSWCHHLKLPYFQANSVVGRGVRVLIRNILHVSHVSSCQSWELCCMSSPLLSCHILTVHCLIKAYNAHPHPHLKKKKKTRFALSQIYWY